MENMPPEWKKWGWLPDKFGSVDEKHPPPPYVRQWQRTRSWLLRLTGWLLAMLFPLMGFTAATFLWQSQEFWTQMLAICVVVITVYLGLQATSMSPKMLAASVVLVWAIWATVLYFGVKRYRTRRVRRARKKESTAHIQKIWSSFSDACRDAGIIEIFKGTLTYEEAEEADPRLLLALPGLVILRSALNSLEQNVDGVRLPCGKVINEKTQIESPGTARFFARLVTVHCELWHASPVNAKERAFLESRSLQICPEPLGDDKREAEMNRVAAVISAAATEATQVGFFRRRFHAALDEIVNGQP